MSVDENLKFAVFFDYDNIEIGVKTTLHRSLDIAAVLEGVNQRGEIVTKVAYGNWSRHPEATRAFTEHGVQMVQRDSTPRGDKNGADINLALDALEMAFTSDHINAFAIASGDSDFMALVNKLKHYNKRVYIVGGKQFTSTILQRNCHEFISYESVMDILPSRSRRRRGGRGSQRPSTPHGLPLDKALGLLDRALSALEVRGARPQLGLLKSTMQQLDPAFSERDFGVASFSTLIEKLEEKGKVKLATIEDHLVVQRTENDEADSSESADAVSESKDGDADDAMDILKKALASNFSLLKIGVPAREVEALVRAVEPDFEEEDYGCQTFGEILNLAQDKGLLRSEADHRDMLRFFPGPDLIESEEQEADRDREDEEDRPRRIRSRRRRRRRSRTSDAAESSDASAEGSSKESAPDRDPAPEPEPKAAADDKSDQAEDEDGKAERPKRKAVKKAAKKAAKKRVKKVVKKKVKKAKKSAKKAAKKASDE